MSGFVCTHILFSRLCEYRFGSSTEEEESTVERRRGRQRPNRTGTGVPVTPRRWVEQKTEREWYNSTRAPHSWLRKRLLKYNFNRKSQLFHQWLANFPLAKWTTGPLKPRLSSLQCRPAPFSTHARRICTWLSSVSHHVTYDSTSKIPICSGNAKSIQMLGTINYTKYRTIAKCYVSAAAARAESTN